MSEPLIFGIIALFILTVIIIGTLFSKKTIVKRKLKEGKRIPIASFKHNEKARVVGRVECIDEPLIAPLSGRKCAYYCVQVEVKKSSGKSSSWHDLIEEEVAGKFVVRDGESCAIVDTSQIKTYLVPDAHFSSGFMNDAAPVLERYLLKHGFRSTGILGLNKTLRYKEGILEIGETVAVYGKGSWKELEQTSLPVTNGKILMLAADGEDPVYLSDDPDTH
jgi:hypothetical protein